ncbi:MAG: ATP-binding protein [Desulfotomaculaceae bacterium]|nr:ATP-binding protein [Desulfotomaculaceae bacterium]
MKAELIENLVLAHCSGDENEFNKALTALAADEEKKGNVRLAAQLVNAYKNGKKKSFISKPDLSSQSTSLLSQGFQQTATPRDKDSMLELYELIKSNVSINDVVLPLKQKEVLLQIVQEQTHSEELMKHNIIPANRLLLCGPPGCGKTITAKAIAHELNLPMAYVRLDGLVSSYLGQTSTNLRKVFDAVKGQHIVLFLDEFDAIAKKRDDANELGELKRVVTTLLQNFDNMPSNVFLIAATNHQHLLDPAIWRRFNLAIVLELPDEEQRITLIIKWLSEFKVYGEINEKKIAKITEGLSCAQIKELITAAAKKYYTNREKIDSDDVITILIQQLTLYSGNNEEIWNVLKSMNEKGVALRTLAEATGIPHTTLNYRIKNIKEGGLND